MDNRTEILENIKKLDEYKFGLIIKAEEAKNREYSNDDLKEFFIKIYEEMKLFDFI